MTEKNSLLAYVEAFSEAFAKLRALPTISDTQKQAAFTEAFGKLSPQEQAKQAYLYWYYGNQRHTQLNKSINQASAKKTALDNGRARGTSKRKADASERKARIEGEVKRFLNNPMKEIGFDLPVAAYATPDDFVVAIKRANLHDDLKDSGIKRIVSPILTTHKKSGS